MQNQHLSQYVDSLGAVLVVYPTKGKLAKRYVELKNDILDNTTKHEQETELNILDQAYEIVTSSFLS
ncbi:hypothetical protein LC040_19510 [Bacillus tianshenii]|nr:hypothetical protein LC040_19510 [Bacillus tianshenii]